MLNYNTTTYLIELIEEAYNHIPLEVYQSATQLAGLIVDTLNHTKIHKLTLEQEYLLETMITKELPNFFVTYKKVNKHSYNDAIKANQILKEQVSLLKNQVHTIRQDNNSIAVQTMQNQLNYLKTKYSSHSDHPLTSTSQLSNS